VQRVSVVGNAGAGKSTAAAQLAAKIGVPYVELDAIFHQPGWAELPRGEFRARVAEIAESDGWVVDGNYSAVREIVWARSIGRAALGKRAPGIRPIAVGPGRR